LAVVVSVVQPPFVMTWFTFTLTRRTQIESITALGPLWARVAGSDAWQVRYAGGLDSSDLLIGPGLEGISKGLKAAATLTLLVVAIRVAGWLRLHGRPIFGPVSRGQLWEVALTTQLAALVLVTFAGPVFSPQYLAWFATVTALAAGAGVLRLEIVLWLVACALTTADFPYLFDRLKAADPLATSVLTARDAVLLVVLAHCLRRLWRLTAS
jgi:hypothetical protein